MHPRGWVYRGHRKDKYTLVPTALRPEALHEFVGETPATNLDQAFAERELLEDFLKVSDSIGLNVPEDTQQLRRDLQTRIEGQIWPPDHALSLMALAQHHGVPTRLLDWSRNPYKAALFAAMNALKKDTDGLLCVWALCVEKLEAIPSRLRPFTIITAPASTNSNLRAQEGVFTIAERIRANGDAVQRISFDELLRRWVSKYNARSMGPWFKRITLPHSQAEALCFGLALEGINRASLFPDFYGVVRTMRDKWRAMREGGPARERAKQYVKSFRLDTTGEAYAVAVPQLIQGNYTTLDYLPMEEEFDVVRPQTRSTFELLKGAQRLAMVKSTLYFVGRPDPSQFGPTVDGQILQLG